MTSPARVSAVVVDFRSGDVLTECVRSLIANAVTDIVVVNNGPLGASDAALHGLDVTLVEPNANLGYGAGVNRGVAAAPRTELVVVANPDVVVHDATIDRLVGFMDEHPAVGICGPTIVDAGGGRYPSVRTFPDPVLAAAHALLSPLWPGNPWTARYRAPGADGRVDWVSGAFFVVRRELFERLGGFDERYFMFGEDMDLCWRAGRAGYSVGVCDAAVVTHIEGVSRQHSERSMLIAHHVGAMRFELRSAEGWRRLLAPLAAAVLAARLALVYGVARARGGRPGAPR